MCMFVYVYIFCTLLFLTAFHSLPRPSFIRSFVSSLDKLRNVFFMSLSLSGPLLLSLLSLYKCVCFLNWFHSFFLSLFLSNVHINASNPPTLGRVIQVKPLSSYAM